MISLHVFTEEPSIKVLLEALFPSMLGRTVNYRIYPHQGKQDLEKALRTTIPSISRIPGARIIVARDQDSADCKDLKMQIDKVLSANCKCPYKIRIVCNELESWYLGDLIAVEKAYSRFRSETYRSKAEFRDVDSIIRPSDYLLKLLPDYNANKYLPKIEVAEKISKFLDIERNTSKSFYHFFHAAKTLTEDGIK